MATGKIQSTKLQQFYVTPGTMVTDIPDNYCYKCGNLVIIDVRLTITATTAKSIDLLFYVPEGYRPKGSTFQTVMDNSNDLPINSSISPQGNVKIYRNHTTSMSSIRFHADYFTD